MSGARRSGVPLMVGEPVGPGAELAGKVQLPAGTVTFLMSDIEGSTRLWSAHPDGMRRAVADTYAILDRAISAHDGVRPVEQGEGDSVVGGFSRASDALAAALQAQLELHAHAWPDGIKLRVRIALHTADAELRDERNYFGLAMARCARLRAIAHGGQTLLARATRDLVVDGLPESVELIDCGMHRLRDLGRPEQVFALAHPGLGEQARALRSLDAFPNNLPDQLTSFIGRADELRQLRTALAETRLLSLTGAGGAGKTRLALQVAADVLERFPDGAWWVDLAPVSDPHVIGDVVAAALGVRPLPTVTALEASCAHLGASRALVVLDNCEHLLEASAAVTEALLRACPHVTVIATSRAPLDVAGETAWRVPSLTLPARERARESLEVLTQSDAVRLFVERALKARADFTVTNDNAPAVAEICDQLDGLPLAIELAAVRVRLMSVEQIAAGLNDRFRLLTGGMRTALPRQQTLRASVEWSHELLTDAERALLRRLSVFAGGFTLALAEATCGDEALPGVDILDLLASLVDKSLVVAEEREGSMRYRLLETVRQYAAERLMDAGEDDAARDRHRDAMLTLAERAAPELHGPQQRAWLDVLDRDAANLTAALDRAVPGDAERALRLCVALTFWWKARGLFEPAEHGFDRALAAGDPEPSALRAHALWGRGYLAAFAGRIEASVIGLQEARVMAQEVGDQAVLARALMALGFLQMFPDPMGSRPINESARDLARACGDDLALITATINLAYTHVIRQELDDAEQLLDETFELCERHGYLELQAWQWLGRCYRPWMAGDASRLVELAERALDFAQAAGEPTSEASAHLLLADHEIATGRPEAALQRMLSSAARATAAGAGLALAFAINGQGFAQVTLGDLTGARTVLEPAVSSGVDHGYMLAFAIGALAETLRLSGEPVTAEARAGEVLAIGKRIGSPLLVAQAKEISGRLAAEREEWAAAETLLHEALALRIEHEMVVRIPQTLDLLAEVAVGVESHEEAARTLGIADRLRAELGLVRWAPDVARVGQLERAVREVLGDDVYKTTHREGRDLSPDEALTWIRRARGARKRPDRGWESLTPTELRVAALVAEGLTNPQVGERMFISRGTVKAHLSHIFAKLGIATRSELAAAAAGRLLDHS